MNSGSMYRLARQRSCTQSTSPALAQSDRSKNHMTQAIAALEVARRIDASLRFHINGNRCEGGGRPASARLRPCGPPASRPPEPLPQFAGQRRRPDPAQDPWTKWLPDIEEFRDAA
jgi:hypothetical protein